MNIKSKTIHLLFAAAISLSLYGCADDTVLQKPVPAGTIPTGIADENSFTLARLPTVVEGLYYAGVESEVSVYAADRHNHPVPDDTVIKFLTNGGRIEPSCLTLDGTCTVTWNSQNPRPDANNPGIPGIAVVLAYTAGEESFNDLNDNDAFDAGETINDISEPFIDHSNDGLRSADEEFVDYDGDNTFDAADGLYTGTSCVGDVTVCKRTGLFVWANASITMSGLAANFVYFPDPATVTADQTLPITIVITDTNGNPLPSETTVELSADDGSVDPSSFTVPATGQNVFFVTYSAPTAAGTDTLHVVATGPVSGVPIEDTIAITVGAAPVPPPPPTYTVGGTLDGAGAGVPAGQTLIIRNNGGDAIIYDDTTTFPVSFTFSTSLLNAAAYAVTVFDDATLDCATTPITGGSSGDGTGTIAAANVTNIAITCD